MLHLSEGPYTAIEEYIRVPISFIVERVLDVPFGADVSEIGALMECSLVQPYEKNYDVIEPPFHWSTTFDTTNWRMFIVCDDDRIVGGAIIAFKCDTCTMLEGRDDLAVLWDIRVSPEYRRRGIGSMLFNAGETWARSRQCRELKIETQNVNVPACKFYLRMGCTLGNVNHHAYPNQPDEIQLLWRKNIH